MDEDRKISGIVPRVIIGPSESDRRKAWHPPKNWERVDTELGTYWYDPNRMSENEAKAIGRLKDDKRKLKGEVSFR